MNTAKTFERCLVVIKHPSVPKEMNVPCESTVVSH